MAYLLRSILLKSILLIPGDISQWIIKNKKAESNLWYGAIAFHACLLSSVQILKTQNSNAIYELIKAHILLNTQTEYDIIFLTNGK